MRPLKIVFFGSDPIALPLLDWLAGEGRDAATVTAVFTQPDRPVGRGRKITPNAIKQWAVTHGLPVHQPEKITATVRDGLAELQPDVSLVLAYGHILTDDFIAVPRLGTLNLHASLLPKFRGASPIQSAVAAGESITGLALMRIVRELDAGPVADVERVPIAPLDTALEVEAKLAAAGVPLLARNLPRLAAGELAFVPQAHDRASFCRRLTPEDGAIDFNRPARELAARINGLFPWPTCRVPLLEHVVKFGLADAIAGSAAPGEVAGADETGLLLGTGDGLLRVHRLQRPGGRMLPAAEFLRGFSVPAGTVLPSAAMRPLTASAPFRA